MSKKPIAPFITAESADFLRDVNWTTLRFWHLPVQSFPIYFSQINYVIIGR
jgi:hypothetical protein